MPSTPTPGQVTPPEGVLYRRLLPDGRLIDVTPLTFGRARLHIGQQGTWWYEDEW